MLCPIIPEPKIVTDLNAMVAAGDMLDSLILSVLTGDERLEYHLQRFGMKAAGIVRGDDVWSFFSRGAKTDAAASGNDGYFLRISEEGIAASASTERGLYYAIATLAKLIECYSRDSLPALEIRDWSDTEIRCDYFDLRSIHPPFEHMLENIVTISEAKLNGLVVEYEDKLPIGEPFNVCNPHFHFTDQMLDRLKKQCWLHFIDLIPLQQSFGHVEYILKDPRYTYLREIPEAVGEMCPFRKGSFDISKALIDEMAKRHPESRFLHIGCDEVWSLGQSEECKADGRSRCAIFIEYVNRIIDEACRMGKTPLLWHDMLENATLEELSRLDKRAIVCIWIYNRNDLIARVADFSGKLDSLGITYWACPAVRAWDEDDRQNYPVLAQRLKNITYWSECISRFSIKGVINTNWAACFALAKPYGVYESSFYTIHFAAERCWNTKADASSFMYRYLEFFHGYKDEGDELKKRGWNNEDFYQILASLDGKLSRNGRIAHLISLLRSFELPTRRRFPLTVVLYRAEFFNSPDETGSLKDKLNTVKKTLEELEPQLRKELSYYLDDYAVEQFMRSRYLVEELLIGKAEEMLGIEEQN